VIFSFEISLNKFLLVDNLRQSIDLFSCLFWVGSALRDNCFSLRLWFHWVGVVTEENQNH